jgi:hypothetical protein
VRTPKPRKINGIEVRKIKSRLRAIKATIEASPMPNYLLLKNRFQSHFRARGARRGFAIVFVFNAGPRK